MVTTSGGTALELRGIVKIYSGGVRAVDGVDLTLERGEIHALSGENGAGKSTLAQIAAGLLEPTSGGIVADGKVGLVRQHFELIDRLRVWENVVLGNEPRSGFWIDAAAAKTRVRALGVRYGLNVDPDAIVETLPVGVAQRVEILRELAREPAVLVLDEPTAVLAPVEIEELFATLQELAAGGTTILVITHKLQEVISYASRVTVMRAGQVVLRSATTDTSLDAIARAMVGGEVPPIAARAAPTLVPVFAATGLRAGDGAHALQEATFHVRGGEIVGIAGVEGNGQSALVDAIYGLLPYEGTMRLGDEPLDGRTPRERIAAGVRIIPQDRTHEGLVLPWSVAENVALGDQQRAPVRRGWTIDRAATAQLATEIVERYDVRTSSIQTPVAALSGGNQQKLLVGRALAHEPRFVVAYQPTRGIDVGAAALVQSRLIEIRNAGTAVLIVSFELDELLTLADRILVMFRGKIAGEFSRATVDRSRIGELMAGKL